MSVSLKSENECFPLGFTPVLVLWSAVSPDNLHLKKIRKRCVCFTVWHRLFLGSFQEILSLFFHASYWLKRICFLFISQQRYSCFWCEIRTNISEPSYFALKSCNCILILTRHISYPNKPTVDTSLGEFYSWDMFGVALDLSKYLFIFQVEKMYNILNHILQFPGFKWELSDLGFKFNFNLKKKTIVSKWNGLGKGM